MGQPKTSNFKQERRFVDKVNNCGLLFVISVCLEIVVMTIVSGEVVGVAEIAEMAKVTKQAVNNWKQRYENFPEPIQTLQSGSVWKRDVIEDWLRRREGRTHVISFINLKGGVGKTTTAVAVAEILAKEHRKSVLVIDLDPQTNASVTLIKEDAWKKRDEQGQTVAQLFADKLDPQQSPKFDIEQAIVRQVSTIDGGIAKLDLLPSSIRLIELQEKIPAIPFLNNTINLNEILRNALSPVLDRYDYVIIDCPPSLGTVTKNGLRISTGYVIPTIPDILSTWGIYQIINNIKKFSNDIGSPIPALGIIATKVQEDNSLHPQILEDLKARRLGSLGKEQPPLFESIIKQNVDTARGVNVDADIRTFRGKYKINYEKFQKLTKEIMDRCSTVKS